MPLSVKCGSITVPTGTGNQGYTGVGFQPKAILFWGNRHSTDGAVVSAASFTPFFGMAVSSTSRVAITEADDFAGGANTADDATKCVKHLSGATTDFAADFVSFDSDGFTLNWTTGNATAYVVNYFALGGSQLTDVFIKQVTSATATGNQASTGVGFRPDAILFAGANDGALDAISIGMAKSATARGTTTISFNGATSGLYQRTSSCYASMNGSAVHTEADFVSMDSDGFTLNWTTANATTHTVYALCLKGGNYFVGSFAQKTSTGNQGYTGVGFQPVGIFHHARGFAAGTTPDTTFGMRWLMGAASGASERAATYYGSGADPVGELIRTKCYTVRADDATPTLLAAADLVSFDSDGFTLNYSTADAVAREVIYMAFGSAAEGGGGGVPFFTRLTAKRIG